MDDAIRSSFDAIADEYARLFVDELDRKPFDREILETFARRCGDGAPVLDLGCGPGHVGAFVARFGPRAIGVDLSPASVARGASLFPAGTFIAADIRRLPLRVGSVRGVLAFYSMIYGPEDGVAAALAECARVLEPGGSLLVTVHGGEGRQPFDDFRGIPIRLTIVLRDPDRMVALAKTAGFGDVEVRTRPPYDFEHQTTRVYLTGRRP